MGTDRPGADETKTASTRRQARDGDPGRQPRRASHAEGGAAGDPWRLRGTSDEVGRLREVLLSWPSDLLALPKDPDKWLMNQWPDLPALRRQCEDVAAFYESRGITVHVHRPATPPPPNYLFVRDLVFPTPEGAVLARPAASVRAGEERFAADVLATLGIPILHAFRGTATFEGADALWLDERTVLVGVGRRTNAEGLAQLRGTLASQGVEVVSAPAPLSAGVQHLLGVVVFVNTDLALVDVDRAPPDLLHLLRERGYSFVELPPGEELSRRRAMNVVVLQPRCLVMPAGCPETRRRLETAGIKVHELDVGEYVKAAGALGCLTAILRRDSA